MDRRLTKIDFENCRIGFKNFAGAEGAYNKAGDRNFVVFISDFERAQELLDEGWNVKFPKPVEGLDEDEDTREPYLPVAVAFGQYPPEIYLITGDNHERLTEETISVLDWARPTNVDLVVRPYRWTTPTGTGVKAYCDQLYVTIENEGFKNKYGF